MAYSFERLNGCNFFYEIYRSEILQINSMEFCLADQTSHTGRILFFSIKCALLDFNQFTSN